MTSEVRRKLERQRVENKLDISTLLLAPDPTRPVAQLYKLVERIGRGSYGSVWLAESIRSGESRAIKLVQKSRINRGLQMDALQIEIEAMVRLDHPNVLKLFEYFEDSGYIYFVTEVCTGGDFTSLSPDNDREEVRLLFRDLVLALAYCHDYGVVHRDLKLENCLLKESPQRRVTKVIDFGLAAIHTPGGADEWMYDLVGTKYYMAPEVIDTSCPYGTKCDMWSVGVLLYIVVTGDHPFASNALKLKTKQLFAAISKKDVRKEPLRKSQVDDCPLREFIFGLLVKDPEQRWSAQQALVQQWLSEADEKTPKRHSRHSVQCAIANAESFAGLQRFQKAMLTVAVNNMESQEVDALRDAFMDFDIERNGRLSKDEFKQGLDRYGLDMSADDIDSTFSALDADGTGKINYTEWLAAAIKPSEITSEKVIREVFDFFDIDGTGKISRDELCQVLGDEAAEMVRIDGDESGDGRLSFYDFRKMMLEIT